MARRQAWEACTRAVAAVGDETAAVGLDTVLARPGQFRLCSYSWLPSATSAGQNEHWMPLGSTSRCFRRMWRALL